MAIKRKLSRTSKMRAIYDGGTFHMFRIGQRVRPSDYGIERNLFPRHKHNQSGVVTKVDSFGCPTVKWDSRKTASGYYYGFIAADRRRKRKQT